MPHDMLTSAALRSILSYDAESGTFIRTQRVGYSLPGAVVGSIGKNGYVYISIYKKKYLAHRLAWLYAYGEWPPVHIDHINGDRSDNRLTNLRAATRSQNLHNAKRRCDNRSGMKGISWSPSRNRWRARVNVNGKEIWNGWFKTVDDAKAAHLSKSIEINGEFWRAE